MIVTAVPLAISGKFESAITAPTRENTQEVISSRKSQWLKSSGVPVQVIYTRSIEEQIAILDWAFQKVKKKDWPI